MSYTDTPEYKKAKDAGQEHVFKFWEKLDDVRRKNLLAEIANVNFDLMNKLFKEVGGAEFKAPPADELAPPNVVAVPKTPVDAERDSKARKVGEKALKASHVAAFLVAGGQGSRLGFEGPKGCFAIGPVTQRTLFDIHAQKIAALRKRYKCKLPWLIMTSDTNHQDTIDFFEKNNYFTLGKDTVWFFMQEMLPALSKDGKLLMSDVDKLFWSPNGHGGSIKALADSGSLNYMEKEGIDTLFYFQVDNPLVKICDPEYLGHHLLKRSEMSCKVIKKRDPFASCGNLAMHKDRLIMIEYSDMPKYLASLRNPDGSLKFWTGSIAIHVFAVDFLKRLTDKGFQVPYHRALKAIAAVDDSGSVVKPLEKNGVKFESFVFDALPMAERTLVMETPEAEEFSPVKNAEGDASPATSRRDMTRLYARWLETAGVNVPRGANGEPAALIEISPLTSLQGEKLEKFKKKKIDFSQPQAL